MKLYELNIKYSSFQILTEALLNIQVFWQVALCRSVHMTSGTVSFSAYGKWRCVVQCIWQVALCHSVRMASGAVSFSAYLPTF